MRSPGDRELPATAAAEASPATPACAAASPARHRCRFGPRAPGDGRSAPEEKGLGRRIGDSDRREVAAAQAASKRQCTPAVRLDPVLGRPRPFAGSDHGPAACRRRYRPMVAAIAVAIGREIRSILLSVAIWIAVGVPIPMGAERLSAGLVQVWPWTFLWHPRDVLGSDNFMPSHLRDLANDPTRCPRRRRAGVRVSSTGPTPAEKPLSCGGRLTAGQSTEPVAEASFRFEFRDSSPTDPSS